MIGLALIVVFCVLLLIVVLKLVLKDVSKNVGLCLRAYIGLEGLRYRYRENL